MEGEGGGGSEVDEESDVEGEGGGSCREEGRGWRRGGCGWRGCPAAEVNIDAEGTRVAKFTEGCGGLGWESGSGDGGPEERIDAQHRDGKGGRRWWGGKEIVAIIVAEVAGVASQTAKAKEVISGAKARTRSGGRDGAAKAGKTDEGESATDQASKEKAVDCRASTHDCRSGGGCCESSSVCGCG